MMICFKLWLIFSVLCLQLLMDPMILSVLYLVFAVVDGSHDPQRPVCLVSAQQGYSRSVLVWDSVQGECIVHTGHCSNRLTTVARVCVVTFHYSFLCFSRHLGSPVWLMIFLLHVALSISSPALSPVLFKSRWHTSFHLVFGRPFFPGTSVLCTFLSVCFLSLNFITCTIIM